MNMAYPHFGLSGYCRLFGITRQAFYQHFRNGERKGFTLELILQQVRSIREAQPRIGARKLLVIMQPFLSNHGIRIGRDAFFELLSRHKMLVRRRVRHTQTTFSKHWMRKWPNLIRNFEADNINGLWVSDITYWKVHGINYYISLVTDVRSRKIIGYCIDRSLKSETPLQALHMALCYKPRTGHLIHHSDRGAQYCSAEYVGMLIGNGIKISMTESGEPTENAIAERVNGILKDEYLYQFQPRTLEQARAILASSVQLYNDKRPHLSIGNQTPNMVFKNKNRKFTRLWKSYAKYNPVNTC